MRQSAFSIRSGSSAASEPQCTVEIAHCARAILELFVCHSPFKVYFGKLMPGERLIGGGLVQDLYSFARVFFLQGQFQ